MIVSQNFIINENYLPSNICDDIINAAQAQKEIEGVIQGGTDKKIRNSRVVWLNEQWIYDWINGVINEINIEHKWNFTISHPEQIQFTKYNEGQFYGWHQDIYENIPADGFQRKISAVIPLVESNTYEGGDLEFYDPMTNPNKKQEDKIIRNKKLRQKGSIIVFPSYIYHQVTPVLKGERLSIVIWFCGEKWK